MSALNDFTIAYSIQLKFREADLFDAHMIYRQAETDPTPGWYKRAAGWGLAGLVLGTVVGAGVIGAGIFSVASLGYDLKKSVSRRRLIEQLTEPLDDVVTKINETFGTKVKLSRLTSGASLA